MNIRRRSLWLLVGILILATAVRLYYIQFQSIWFDEGWSAYAAVQPTLLRALEADPTNPPLYYVLLNVFEHGFGDSTLALRWVSTAFGLLLIPLTYQLGKHLFDERAGLAAAFLTAFCPLLWWASQEIRMYTLLALLVTVAALAWHTLLRRSSWRAWLALWGSELALLYAHNTGPVVVVWLNAITIIVWFNALRLKVLSRQSSIVSHQSLVTSQKSGHSYSVLSTQSSALSSPHSALITRSSLLIWFAGQIGVALVWSPWFISHFLLLPSANSAVSHISPLNGTLLSELWQAVWTGPWAMVNQEPLVTAFSALIFIVAVLLIPWRKAAARWLVLHVALLTAGVWLGLAFLGNEIHGRYLVMIAPLLLVVIGAGVGRLWRSNVHFVGTQRAASLRRIYPYTIYPILALFAASFLTSIHFAVTNPAYQHDDVRGMVQYYADHLTTQDTVLDWSYADRYELAYYWPRLGVKAQRVTLPEGADLDAILPLLPKSGDVALNIWYTQRADYRGMMSCVLGNGTINLPEQYTVYGMSDLLYRAPSLDLPELKPANISVGDFAHINAVGGVNRSTADQALCLPIKLTLTQKTNADLKVVVVVLNNLGWEIARADTIFADAAERTTSQLNPGDSVTAYPLLRLPYGTFAGTYPMFVTVYNELTQPSGYDLNPNDGSSPTLKDALLGAWGVNPGAQWLQVNRISDLPVTTNIHVGDNLTLIGHNISGETFRNGDALRLTLLWKGSGALPDLTLADTKGAWSITVPASLPNEHDSITLDWREVHIPPDAPDGTAEVRLLDGRVLGRYTIESLPALYDEPTFDVAKRGDYLEAGNLIGYSVSGDMTDRSQPFTLTLVWKAFNPANISYTVFAQLVTDDGRVLAQSDSIPANGSRPTTGWREGEYIVDAHQVVFHDDARPGKAHLIVGFYDAISGQRLVTATGGDSITLREDINVR